MRDAVDTTSLSCNKRHRFGSALFLSYRRPDVQNDECCCCTQGKNVCFFLLKTKCFQIAVGLPPRSDGASNIPTPEHRQTWSGGDGIAPVHDRHRANGPRLLGSVPARAQTGSQRLSACCAGPYAARCRLRDGVFESLAVRSQVSDRTKTIVAVAVKVFVITGQVVLVRRQV